MRLLAFVTALLLMTVADTTRAKAQNYPWCAYYGGNMGGSENCGFANREQCVAAIGGMGGFCARNTQYVPSATAPVPQGPAPRRHGRRARRRRS